MNTNQKFGKVRSILFPIHGHELRKFLPLAAIFFIISFNYAGLRSLKDMFLLQNTDAEVIYYLKLFGVTPGILLFTILYGKVTKTTGRDGRFNAVVGYFLLFFIACYFVFIPNLPALQLDQTADNLIGMAPKAKGLWQALRYWPLSLFYIHAEAWGTMALGVLFWTFVNEISTVEQAKRFYSFLSLGAAMGLMVAGMTLKHFQTDFVLMLGVIIGLTVAMLIMYNMFAHDIRSNPLLYQVEVKPKKKKAKMSFGESFKFLLRSRYLALIATIVIAYGSAVSLFESVWKSQIKKLTQIAGDGVLSDIYGDQGVYGGIISLVVVLFVSAPVMRRGWRFAALVTPVITLLATVVFFSFLLFDDAIGSRMGLSAAGLLPFAVHFGLLNVIFVKSVKYVLFDTTKEQAYIPLDEESKVRGKAAVDGVGSRLGKSLGSIVVTLLTLSVGSIDDAKGIVFVVIVIMLLLWIRAINKLSVEFRKKNEEQETESTVAK